MMKVGVGRANTNCSLPSSLIPHGEQQLLQRGGRSRKMPFVLSHLLWLPALLFFSRINRENQPWGCHSYSTLVTTAAWRVTAACSSRSSRQVVGTLSPGRGCCAGSLPLSMAFPQPLQSYPSKVNNCKVTCFSVLPHNVTHLLDDRYLLLKLKSLKLIEVIFENLTPPPPPPPAPSKFLDGVKDSGDARKQGWLLTALLLQQEGIFAALYWWLRLHPYSGPQSRGRSRAPGAGCILCLWGFGFSGWAHSWWLIPRVLRKCLAQGRV